jgi:AcrR family transcriptional regulator
VRFAEAVILKADLDPWLTLRALSAYAGISPRLLRRYIGSTEYPLPCYRLGEPGRDGRRGAKVLVRRSDFDRWMERWRQQRAAPPKDLDAIVAQALAGVRRGPKKHQILDGSRPNPRRRKPSAGRGEA